MSSSTHRRSPTLHLLRYHSDNPNHTTSPHSMRWSIIRTLLLVQLSRGYSCPWQSCSLAQVPSSRGKRSEGSGRGWVSPTTGFLDPCNRCLQFQGKQEGPLAHRLLSFLSCDVVASASVEEEMS
jgi:hypothetical protein